MPRRSFCSLSIAELYCGIMMNQAFEMPLDIVVNSEKSTQPANQLEIAYGGCSLQGRRDENQDALIVKHPSSLTERAHKGSIACIADGVSCSDYGQQASHTSVMQFVSDYYATPNTWSVKHSTQKVLTALNSWLFNSSEKTRLSHNGLVTTFSTVIFKSNTAHLFHVGDSRIYLYRKGKLRQLTRDHQRKSLGQQHFLTRALGMDDKLDIDYQTLPIKKGDLFLLTTDGVHEYLQEETLIEELSQFSGKYEHAAKAICHQALAHNSKDNISTLLVQVTDLPRPSVFEFQKVLQTKTIPPALSEGNRIDHYVVKKVIHAGARSHVYLVQDSLTQQDFVLKAPSLNNSEDPETLLSFYNEQWAGMNLNNPKIMKVYPTPAHSKFLYQLCEPVAGITLRQWMYDHPTPEIEEVRAIISQVITAVRALQRAEMVHRDLKPENIIIQPNGEIKVIDLGAVLVKGLEESHDSKVQVTTPPLGAANYIAPEYLNSSVATTQSDLFSVAVISYEILTGKLPYKTVDTQSLANARHQEWHYRSILETNRRFPEWLDLTLKKACHPNPKNRYMVLSEFVTDFTTPNMKLQKELAHQPLLERNPIFFWKCLALLLAIVSLSELFLLIQ